MPAPRVLVTGLGPLCSLGQDRESFWGNLAAGRSFVAPVERLKGAPVNMGAEVKELKNARLLSPKERRLDRSAQFAILAAHEALDDAGLLDGEGRFLGLGGVIVGSSRGPCSLWDECHRSFLRSPRGRVSPAASPLTTPGNLAGAVSRRFGLRGPSIMVSTACASGSHAIGLAFQMIRAGMEEVMVAGGTEAALNPFEIAMFAAAGILAASAPAPRPFDRDRDGTVIGEGAGMIVLESELHWRARRVHGRSPYCELAGFGASSDALSLAAVPPDGEGLARAIAIALKDARLDPQEIGYVNAHGTGTRAGDWAETRALKSALGAHAYDTAISSTKSMTGHLLGAAGGVEAVICALALARGVVPPTIHLDVPGEGCDLDYVPGKARSRSLQAALSSSMGFGGTNACLAFRRAL